MPYSLAFLPNTGAASLWATAMNDAALPYSLVLECDASGTASSNGNPTLEELADAREAFRWCQEINTTMAMSRTKAPRAATTKIHHSARASAKL